jgi:DNA-binding transcriptional regulator YhcF (GntR family)
VLPFSVSLRPGVPIYEQVIYAVTRAVVTGQLRAGDAFPSVRALSQALKINPNTAHKIVAALIEDGLLVPRPGIGTVVTDGRQSKALERRALLEDGAERLVVDARRVGLPLQEVLGAIRRHWGRTIDRTG